MYWFRKRRRRSSTVTKHYVAHKELAREIILDRLAYWNQQYNFAFKRVAIRNQKTCWGSCSDKGNLNFNYKLIFLPSHLMDYVIVHELCHLQILNHGRGFWNLVRETLPDYEQRILELRAIEKQSWPAYLANRSPDTEVTTSVTPK